MPDTADAILSLPAHQQAARLRAGDVTARALAEAASRRVRAQEPALNAYITLTDDEALAMAEDADVRLRAGTATPFPAPALQRLIVCSRCLSSPRRYG